MKRRLDNLSVILVTLTIINIVLILGCGDNWFADQNDDHSIRTMENSSGFPFVKNEWRPETLEEWMEIYLDLDEPRGYTVEEWEDEF